MLNNLFKKDGSIDENVAKQHRLFDMLLNLMNEAVGNVVIFVLPSPSRDYVYFKHEFEKYHIPAEGVRYNSFLTDHKPIDKVFDSIKTDAQNQGLGRVIQTVFVSGGRDEAFNLIQKIRDDGLNIEYFII